MIDSERITSADGAVFQFPVSMKGVVIHRGATVLLKNERNEWELPGGKLDPDESPEECVQREINEELSLSATTSELLDVWVYNIRPGRTVLIVTFGMEVDSLDGMKCSNEHKEARAFPLAEVDRLNMPAGYKASIANWAIKVTGNARRA